ncbi:MAG: aldo/keto reductase [Roseivirga sp.]|nr:aldo/keto reductase [Roseivirga sp.]
MNRRNTIKFLAALPLFAQYGYTDLFRAMSEIQTRKIPSSGESIPIVGLGTWQTFDVGSSASARTPLQEVLKLLVEQGGMVVDSSPMYGSSESVVGDLATELKVTERLFMATKVWTSGKQSGISQMNRSMNRMRKRPIDLMQIHNLQDWKTHMKTLQAWKEEGKLRYTGITHYLESAYGRLEDIMKAYPIDFVQLNYSIVSRESERRLLPLAKEKGIAILTNRPYEGGSLFRKTRGQALPGLAKDLDCSSWGQFFLKYILSHEAVTCAIPGTSKAKHLIDNLGAGKGPMPNASQRKKMVSLVNNL